MKNEYPRIRQLGIVVYETPIAHVLRDDLYQALGSIANKARFSDLFGIQTCPLIGSQETGYKRGLYPWDVEAVLERMASGRLTGSQLIWD